MKLARIAVSGLTLCFLLSACATSGTSPSQSADISDNMPDIGPDAFSQRPEDYVAQVAYWGGIYEGAPGDRQAALNYGRNLRYVKRYHDAIDVLGKALASQKDDPVLQAEYGKALTAAGRAAEGAEYLARANTATSGDWVMLSAEGVALDQLGDHDQARLKYELALRKSPGNAAILNNLALSRALAGDLDSAEQHLREAVKMPQANAQIRQNLALVLGLKGDFAEARRYASIDLPPAMVEANIDYMRRLLATPTSPWSQLEALEHAAP